MDLEFGCICVIKKDGTDGHVVPLRVEKLSFGAADNADIRLKLSDTRLKDIHCILKVVNGYAVLINKSIISPVLLCNKPLVKETVLKHNDVFQILTRKFKYINPVMTEEKLSQYKILKVQVNPVRQRFTIGTPSRSEKKFNAPKFASVKPSRNEKNLSNTPASKTEKDVKMSASKTPLSKSAVKIPPKPSSLRKPLFHSAEKIVTSKSSADRKVSRIPLFAAKQNKEERSHVKESLGILHDIDNLNCDLVEVGARAPSIILEEPPKTPLIKRASSRMSPFLKKTADIENIPQKLPTGRRISTRKSTRFSISEKDDGPHVDSTSEECISSTRKSTTDATEHDVERSETVLDVDSTTDFIAVECGKKEVPSIVETATPITPVTKLLKKERRSSFRKSSIKISESTPVIQKSGKSAIDSVEERVAVTRVSVVEIEDSPLNSQLAESTPVLHTRKSLRKSAADKSVVDLEEESVKIQRKSLRKSIIEENVEVHSGEEEAIAGCTPINKSIVNKSLVHSRQAGSTPLVKNPTPLRKSGRKSTIDTEDEDVTPITTFANKSLRRSMVNKSITEEDKNVDNAEEEKSLALINFESDEEASSLETPVNTSLNPLDVTLSPKKLRKSLANRTVEAGKIDGEGVTPVTIYSKKSLSVRKSIIENDDLMIDSEGTPVTKSTRKSLMKSFNLENIDDGDNSGIEGTLPHRESTVEQILGDFEIGTNEGTPEMSSMKRKSPQEKSTPVKTNFNKSSSRKSSVSKSGVENAGKSQFDVEATVHQRESAVEQILEDFESEAGEETSENKSSTERKSQRKSNVDNATPVKTNSGTSLSLRKSAVNKSIVENTEKSNFSNLDYEPEDSDSALLNHSSKKSCDSVSLEESQESYMPKLEISRLSDKSMANESCTEPNVSLRQSVKNLYEKLEDEAEDVSFVKRKSSRTSDLDKSTHFDSFVKDSPENVTCNIIVEHNDESIIPETPALKPETTYSARKSSIRPGCENLSNVDEIEDTPQETYDLNAEEDQNLQGSPGLKPEVGKSCIEPFVFEESPHHVQGEAACVKDLTSRESEASESAFVHPADNRQGVDILVVAESNEEPLITSLDERTSTTKSEESKNCTEKTRKPILNISLNRNGSQRTEVSLSEEVVQEEEEEPSPSYSELESDTEMYGSGIEENISEVSPISSELGPTISVGCEENAAADSTSKIEKRLSSPVHSDDEEVPTRSLDSESDLKLKQVADSTTEIDRSDSDDDSDIEFSQTTPFFKQSDLTNGSFSGFNLSGVQNSEPSVIVERIEFHDVSESYEDSRARTPFKPLVEVDPLEESVPTKRKPSSPRRHSEKLPFCSAFVTERKKRRSMGTLTGVETPTDIKTKMSVEKSVQQNVTVASETSSLDSPLKNASVDESFIESTDSSSFFYESYSTRSTRSSTAKMSPEKKITAQREPKNDLSNVGGVKQLMKTPRPAREPTNDLSDVRGVKKLLATPFVVKNPANDLSDVRGVKRLLRTPRVANEPKNDLTDIKGVKKLLVTPKVAKSPKNDLTDVRGVKKLLKTPKVGKEPKNDLTEIKGVKKLLATPKPIKSPNNDLRNVRGVKKLLATPKPVKSPKNDLTEVKGLKKLLATPKPVKSPNNDLRDVRGVKKLLKTPRNQRQPKNDLSDVSGVNELFADHDTMFDALKNQKPLRTYQRRSDSPKKSEISEVTCVAEAVQVKPDTERWVEEQCSEIKKLQTRKNYKNEATIETSTPKMNLRTKRKLNESADFIYYEHSPSLTLRKSEKTEESKDESTSRVEERKARGIKKDPETTKEDDGGVANGEPSSKTRPRRNVKSVEDEVDVEDQELSLKTRSQRNVKKVADNERSAKEDEFDVKEESLKTRSRRNMKKVEDTERSVKEDDQELSMKTRSWRNMEKVDDNRRSAKEEESLKTRSRRNMKKVEDTERSVKEDDRELSLKTRSRRNIKKVEDNERSSKEDEFDIKEESLKTRSRRNKKVDDKERSVKEDSVDIKDQEQSLKTRPKRNVKKIEDSGRSANEDKVDTKDQELSLKTRSRRHVKKVEENDRSIKQDEDGFKEDGPKTRTRSKRNEKVEENISEILPKRTRRTAKKIDQNETEDGNIEKVEKKEVMSKEITEESDTVEVKTNLRSKRNIKKETGTGNAEKATKTARSKKTVEDSEEKVAEVPQKRSQRNLKKDKGAVISEDLKKSTKLTAETKLYVNLEHAVTPVRNFLKSQNEGGSSEVRRSKRTPKRPAFVQDNYEVDIQPARRRKVKFDDAENTETVVDTPKIVEQVQTRNRRGNKKGIVSVDAKPAEEEVKEPRTRSKRKLYNPDTPLQEVPVEQKRTLRNRK